MLIGNFGGEKELAFHVKKGDKNVGKKRESSIVCVSVSLDRWYVILSHRIEI